MWNQGKHYFILFLSAVFLLFFTGCGSLRMAYLEPQPIPTFVPRQEKVKIALVLGSGGSKGLAHLGVLKEMEEMGIRPDFIVGCSSGAIIGALYADEPNIARLEKIFLKMRRSDLFDFSLFDARFAIASGKRLRSFLQANLKARTFEELKIPLVVAATDLREGSELELGAGEIIPAIQASAALPGFFPPVLFLGRYLVDGGVSNPVPVSIAKKYGAQVVIAVDIGEKLSKEEPSHFFHVASRSFHIAYRSLTSHCLKEADLILTMDFQDLGTFNDEKNEIIYQRGREVAREFLPKIISLLAEKEVDSPQKS
ncbi:MAG: patatin-like phospholipase family protein [Simkania negevensis]|nr:patatin-like phospholipase family protein [Simkania negevensis]